MAKIKVGELAKQIKLSTKELLEKLKELGVEAKTAASSIDREVAKVVKDVLPAYAKAPAGKKREKKKPQKRAAAKARVAKKKEEKAAVKVPAEVKEKPEIEVPTKKIVFISEPKVMVKDLAQKIGVKAGDVIKELMKKGVLVTINQAVDFSIAKEIASTFDVEVKAEKKVKKEEAVKAKPEEAVELEPRPPVVTIMGHVDHGKTKLLDAIRKTNVIETEAGGITQHIGAYQVDIEGRKITFLDTPGHEAFTALRARGAKVTDIAVLVVAADEGVKPQTIEAYHHAKAAGVPIIVAINKIDKPEANPEKVKRELSELGLMPEEWGGKTVTVPVSAKLIKGIDELLEMILLVTDMQELKASQKRKATGIVIESRLDRRMGPLATLLIKDGVLKVGDAFAVGNTFGKVRAILTDRGERIAQAVPSFPAAILGISEVPSPGDLLQVVENERDAKLLAFQRKEIQDKVFKGRILTLEDYSKHVKEGERKDLNLIIKADVQGSLEALTQALSKLSLAGIHLNLIHGGVGNITESDIMLAKASQAIVIGFHCNFDGNAKNISETEGVDVRLYNIIYKVTDDIKLAMEGMLEPEYEEVVIGRAEVRTLFKYSKVGVIAGSYVLEGKIKRGGSIRVLRQGKKIFEGKLDSLKRFKEDVKEVSKDFECGIAIMKYSDFKEGDIIEAYEVREKPRRRV